MRRYLKIGFPTALACIGLMTFLAVSQNGTATAQTTANNPRDSIKWNVTEGTLNKDWTRVGNGGTDEQSWMHWADDEGLRVHYAGNKVYVERFYKLDRTFYWGTISADGRSISGNYLSEHIDSITTWSATLYY